MKSFLGLNPNKARLKSDLNWPEGGGFHSPYEINVCIHIQTCHTCMILFFHVNHNENVFFLIHSHQGVQEYQERQPGGVQQEKLDVMFRIHLITLFFYGRYKRNVFIIILRPPGCPRTLRTTSWLSTTRKTYVN